MKVIGKRIFNQERELINGLMGPTSKEITKKERSMAKENLFGLMGQLTTEILKKIISKEKESILGPMVVAMKENGLTTKGYGIHF